MNLCYSFANQQSRLFDDKVLLSSEHEKPERHRNQKRQTGNPYEEGLFGAVVEINMLDCYVSDQCLVGHFYKLNVAVVFRNLFYA
jgi:hypothetical protein